MKYNNSFPENTLPILIPVNLSFFAGEDKTEQPTAKKKQKSRQEGQVAKSQEINTAVLFIIMFSVLKVFASSMIQQMMQLFSLSIDWAGSVDIVLNPDFVVELGNYLFTQIILISAPLFAVAIMIGLVTNLAQVGWHPTTKPLMPKLTKLNPISGFKRLFSMRQVMELVKSLLKLTLITYAMYLSIKKQIDGIGTLLSMNLMDAFAYIGEMALDLGIMVGGLYLMIAALDYAYQRFKHNKELKMSKQEVKDEYKQTEGDPQIRGKIKQKMREASARRMMQDVPKADVIITNPTHYAVAIAYDRSTGGAPVVLAKGADYIARKIKEKAQESHIEIVENKQVARALYETVDVGREIPPELYQAVAEILAFVYKMKNIV